MKRWLNRRGRRALYRVRFRAGDVAVLEVRDCLTADQAEQIQQALADAVPPGVTIVVISGVST